MNEFLVTYREEDGKEVDRLAYGSSEFELIEEYAYTDLKVLKIKQLNVNLLLETPSCIEEKENDERFREICF